MKYYILLLSLSVGITLQSCNATKNKENQEKSEPVAQKIDAEKMLSDGFKKGTITQGKSGCTYILTVDGMNDSMDPINLDKFFKAEVPEKVWVKYGGLRMANRCPEARPINITEISERTE